jgi:hypothetical protein
MKLKKSAPIERDKAFKTAMRIAGVIGRRCAWAGCDHACTDELPPDWVDLLVWRAPWPEPKRTAEEIALSPYCIRDAVLCAEHARALEALLTPIRLDARLVGEPAGEA